MGNIALYTISVSKHLLSFFEALDERLGRCCTYYYVTKVHDEERAVYGWDNATQCQSVWAPDASTDGLRIATVLIEMMRNLSLLEVRAKAGLLTFYCAERWFKPPLGFLRVFVPSYFRMVRRFLRALKAPTMRLLPQGVHAARDFARLMGLFSGDFRCLFRSPKVAFESRPGGSVVPLKQAIEAGVLDKESVAFAKRHGFVRIPKEQWGKVRPTGLYAKMRLWGYFVPPGQGKPAARADGPLRILWVGRMLKLKRVDTLIEAVKGLPSVTLDLYGRGPEEENLRRLAAGCEAIRFHDFVQAEQVRDLMRAHDVYVFASDGRDGWGAVVSEALEEDMTVIGTVEAGASATMLPLECLYPAGDVAALRRILEALYSGGGGRIGPWTAQNAAESFVSLLKEEAYVSDR